jgi:hypothetical protein
MERNGLWIDTTPNRPEEMPFWALWCRYHYFNGLSILSIPISYCKMLLSNQLEASERYKTNQKNSDSTRRKDRMNECELVDITQSACRWGSGKIRMTNFSAAFNARDLQTINSNTKYKLILWNIKETRYNDNGETKTEPKDNGNLRTPTWALNPYSGHTIDEINKQTNKLPANSQI